MDGGSTGMSTTHDRTDAHHGTEPTTVVTISTTIGQYAIGTDVQTVLEHMFARLAQVEADYSSGFERLILNAFVQPYFGINAYLGTSPLVIGLDAVIAHGNTFGLSAVVKYSFGITTFGTGAFLVAPGGDAASFVVNPISSSDTTITVANGTIAPAVPFDIIVNGETMTVTAVAGNVWTVTRNNPADHPAGSMVVVC